MSEAYRICVGSRTCRGGMQPLVIRRAVEGGVGVLATVNCRSQALFARAAERGSRAENVPQADTDCASGVDGSLGKEGGKGRRARLDCRLNGMRRWGC